MSLHENNPSQLHTTVSDDAPPDVNELRIQDEVRAVVAGVLIVDEEKEISARGVYGLEYSGSLQLDPDEAYQQLEATLTPLGFTAFLHRMHGADVVVAMQGLLEAEDDTEPASGQMRRVMHFTRRSPWWLHGGLLVATMVSAIFAGSVLLDANIENVWDGITSGLPFALSLLFILGVHEMGHYIAARRHGVNVTLPYFIPLPIPGTLGTLGAVIFIRSSLKTRRALFDVGVSGPLLGMVVALPLFVIGLLLPPIEFAPINMVFRGVGVPVLLDWIGSLVVDGSISRAILSHPVALAAWFGVLLTALNLLPMGQFDGGHVVYALFGRYAWGVAFVAFALLIIGGIVYWPTWFIWAMLAGLTGLRHPPPHNDITPLDPKRRIVGFATIVLFLLIIVPQPIITRQAMFSRNSNSDVPIPTLDYSGIPTPAPLDLNNFIITDMPD